jgi:flagellar biosynthesis GTPase FlhF
LFTVLPATLQFTEFLYSRWLPLLWRTVSSRFLPVGWIRKNSTTSFKINPAVDEGRQTKFTDDIPVSNLQQQNDADDKEILIRMRHKLQKLDNNDDDYNPFIAEIKKQVNESHESNNKMIEEILAKEREEMARTLEERDAEHKAEIEEINSRNKEEIQNLNAKHEADFAAEILQLQEKHQNEIRTIRTKCAMSAVALKMEMASCSIV